MFLAFSMSLCSICVLREREKIERREKIKKKRDLIGLVSLSLPLVSCLNFIKVKAA